MLSQPVLSRPLRRMWGLDPTEAGPTKNAGGKSGPLRQVAQYGCAVPDYLQRQTKMEGVERSQLGMSSIDFIRRVTFRIPRQKQNLFC